MSAAPTRCAFQRATGMVPISFFFFQAEDGIRDLCVTGVQTCALPILHLLRRDRLGRPARDARRAAALPRHRRARTLRQRRGQHPAAARAHSRAGTATDELAGEIGRASYRERVYILVGDECVKKKWKAE